MQQLLSVLYIPPYSHILPKSHLDRGKSSFYRFEGMSLKHLDCMRFKIDFDLNRNSSKARSIRLHLITHYTSKVIPITQMDVCVGTVCMMNVFYDIGISEIV